MTGSTLKQKTEGHLRSVKTPENIERVRQVVQTSPRRPMRRQAAALGMSLSEKNTAHESTISPRWNCNCFQHLKLHDYDNHQRFLQQMIHLMDDEKILVMSDRGSFSSDWYINKQNFRCWSALLSAPWIVPKLQYGAGFLRSVLLLGRTFLRKEDKQLRLTVALFKNVGHFLDSWTLQRKTSSNETDLVPTRRSNGPHSKCCNR